MGKLIKAEFLKLSKSLGFKILILCSLGAGVLVGILLLTYEMPAEVSGYNVYLQSLVDTQLHGILTSVFVAVFLCNEFVNRTFGMSLFSGCPRRSVLFSKIIVFLVGLLPVLFAESLSVTVITTIIRGFGVDLNVETWKYLIRTTLLYILGNAAMGGFCVILAILIKNIGGTIGAGIGFILVIAVLNGYEKFEPVMKFTFLYQLNQVVDLKSYGLFIMVSVVTLVVTLITSLIIFEKSELK